MAPEQRGVTLPNAAKPAWRAYCNMLNTKDAHFGYLEALGSKYQAGGTRTLSEITYLEKLLQAHDACVAAFAQETKALGRRDAEAHAALITAIADINQALGDIDGQAKN